MKVSKFMLPLLLSCTLIAGSGVQAQIDNSGQNNSNTKVSTNQPVSDQDFINKSIRDNRLEIEMAQLALEKSENDNVKHIAQMLVDDHSKMVQELTKIGGASVNDDAGDTNNNGAGTNGRSSAGDTGTASNQLDIAGTKTTKDLDSNEVGGDSSASHKNNSQAANTDAKAILANASGDEFDRMWIDQMLTKHKLKLGDLHTAKNSVSDQRLKSLINTAIPKIRAHRDMLAEVKSDPDKPLKMTHADRKK